jgi:hypothetical protein
MTDTANTAPQDEATAPEVQAPEVIFSQDGDKICATFKDFINLQESPAGFGDTEEEAKANLFQEVHNAKKPFGVKIFICAIENEMPHELATAHLRSKVPFTKEKIEGFIASDEFTSGLQKAIKEEGKEVSIFYMITNDPVAETQETPTGAIDPQ